MFVLLYLCHHTEPVAAPYLADVFLGVALAQEIEGEAYGFGSIGHTRHTAVAVEIGTQPHMVYAHDVDSMAQVV